MKGTIKKLTIYRHECLLYLPPEYGTSRRHYPVVYLNGGDKIQDIIDGMEFHFDVDCQAFILLCIQPVNWYDDFSPWPVSPLAKNSEAFGGGAFEYLNYLAEVIKPFMDEHYRTMQEPENTALVGYSLGGLTALYALYTCRTFGKIGSLSGSLWYEDFIEFMESNMLLNTGAKVYLSLGKGEERIRNERMAKVGDCTRKAAEILIKQLNIAGNLILEWNNGGHFTEIPHRHQKAILWLMRVSGKNSEGM